MQIFFEKLTVDDNSAFLFVDIKLPRFTSPLHVHDEFELIYIKHSSGKLFTGGTVNNFRDGDLFFFAPGLSHCFYNDKSYPDNTNLANAIVLQFEKSLLGEIIFEKIEAVRLKKLFLNANHGIQFLNPSKDLINRILKIDEKKGFERIIELLAVLHELSQKKKTRLLTSERIEIATRLQDSKRITDVYKYVAENFRLEISFEKAAEIANMQKAAFCRYFQRKTNKKFSRFVNEVRCAHAIKLLSESDKTITEICYECGFNNFSYFNRQFKLIHSRTPKDLRAELKV